jgi:aminoglycoside phosphotransferase (APT) family kinase protein
MTDVEQTLRTIMARITGQDASIENLARLSGGANMESSSFDHARRGYVLRRAPSAEMMAGRPFGHDVEAAIIRAACAAGVKAPEIVGELEAGDAIGTGYIMRRVEAEVNPAKILAEPPPSLIHDLARELARIHAIPVAALPAIPTMDTATALGDLRMGNVMVDGHGLAAVLDWELAHFGDAHEDLAYGCLTVWRFGHIEKPAFGCSSLETYFHAYEAAGGIPVDRARFRFWLIYRTLWWALGCLQMAEIWRAGVDRTLERAVIGRRTSENETDLLLLLEEDAPETQRLAIRLDDPPAPRRMGEPSAVEMLEAVRDWVDTDIKSKAQGRDKFMAAVAMNALGMLIREASNPVSVHDKPLCDDLLAGRLTLATPGLLARLRKMTLAKLANDVPKYATLAKARDVWGAG